MASSARKHQVSTPSPSERSRRRQAEARVRPGEPPGPRETGDDGLREIFAATPLGMVALGPRGELRHWNDAFGEICGGESADFAGRCIDEVAGPEIGTEFKRLQSTLRDSGDRQCFEVRCVRPGGDDAYVRLTVGRIQLNGEEPGLLGVLEDVTSRRRTEQEMHSLELQLRQAQKLEAIGQLAAGIAHEINTPTQYVSDNTEFLRRGFAAIMEAVRAGETLMEAVERGTPDPALAAAAREVYARARIDIMQRQVPRALEQSLEGLNRVTNIVAALKEFSHPSRGEKRPVDLAHAIETTATVARNEWKYVADLETDFDPDLPAVPALPDELNQVILNLIVNAAHAIAEANAEAKRDLGTIRIETGREDSWAVIRVRDNGNGVPPGIRDKIFNPFYTTKEVGKGTGQGLAIARSVVVDKHGGSLSVEGEPGEGATFVVRLPLWSATERVQEEAA